MLRSSAEVGFVVVDCGVLLIAGGGVGGLGCCGIVTILVGLCDGKGSVRSISGGSLSGALDDESCCTLLGIQVGLRGR